MVERMRRRGQQPPAPPDDGLRNVRIVLVRPRGSANVGAAARAMKNMGVGALTLVQPAVRRLAAAEAMAVHARDLVRSARVAASVSEAVGDCAQVVGTTCRGGAYRAGAEDPEQLAPQLLAAAAHGPVAVLFGPEDHGLTNDDLRFCQRLLTIDSSSAYASLNLAQAVLLVCYELRRAARAARRQPDPVAPAPARAVQRMYQHLQQALLSIGFLHPQNPEHLMFAIRRLFGRTALEDHEVRILLGIARQMEWAAEKGVTSNQLPVTGHADVEGDGNSVHPALAMRPLSQPAPDHRSAVTGHRPRPFPHHG